MQLKAGDFSGKKGSVILQISYLSSHEHEVVEHQRGRLQGAPAVASQTGGHTHALPLTVRFFLWRAGARGWGQEPRVY